MEITHHTKQGIPVYVQENRTLHSFNLCLYTRSGSIYEKAEENGITHFVEHLVFRNINRLHAGRSYAELNRLGLDFNATTYKEFVQFTVSGVPTHFREAADLLCEVFSPIDLPGKEIRAELGRIRAVILENDSNGTPDGYARARVWEGTTVSRPTSGTLSSVSRLSATNLRRWQRAMFSRKNVFFYLTGHIDERELPYLLTAIDNYAFSDEEPLRDNTVSIPADMFHRNGGIRVHESDDTAVRFGIDVDTAHWRDAELMLFEDILCGDYDSLIQQTLSERDGMVYGVDAVIERYKNVGSLQFGYEIQERDLAASLRTVAEQFARMKDPEALAEPLAEMKVHYTEGAATLLDNPEDFNWCAAYENHILNLRYPDLEARIAAYASVTPARVAQLAREVLVPSHLVIEVTGKHRKPAAGWKDIFRG